MGPDPSLLLTRSKKEADPALTRILSDLTRSNFFYPKGRKLKNLTFLGDIFEIQTHTTNGWPDPTRATKIWPDLTRVKKFWPGPITIKGTLWMGNHLVGLITLDQRLPMKVQTSNLRFPAWCHDHPFLYIQLFFTNNLIVSSQISII